MTAQHDADALREALARADADPSAYAGPRGDRDFGQWRAEAGLAAVAEFMAALLAENATLRAEVEQVKAERDADRRRVTAAIGQAQDFREAARAAEAHAARLAAQLAGAAQRPDVIAAAWKAWHARHGGKLGPGPAFVEAIATALATITQTEKDHA